MCVTTNKAGLRPWEKVHLRQYVFVVDIEYDVCSLHRYSCRVTLMIHNSNSSMVVVVVVVYVICKQ